MVTSDLPASAGASSVQLFTARPSRCTTQAPHWLVSQPIWVPVRLSFSRSSSVTRGAGSLSTGTGFAVEGERNLHGGTPSLKKQDLSQWAGTIGDPGREHHVADIERIGEEHALGHV